MAEPGPHGAYHVYQQRNVKRIPRRAREPQVSSHLDETLGVDDDAPASGWVDRVLRAVDSDWSEATEPVFLPTSLRRAA